MKKTLLALSTAALAALGSAPAAAQSASPEYGQEARIAFADHGAIRNWRDESRDALLIEARGGNWYRAEFFGPCNGLRFTEALGFETNPDGSFDRFSTVRTRDDVCRVRSLVTIPDPDAAPDPSES